MKIKLNYGKGKIALSVPDRKLISVVQPNCSPPVDDPQQEVHSALIAPIGIEPLSEHIRKRKGNPNIVITIEDHTRPVPNEIILPPIIEELKRGGVPEEQITLVVATGTHRKLNEKEISELQRVIGKKIPIINHEASNEGKLIEVGHLSYKEVEADLLINKEVATADFLLLTGDIEFHQLFGYGGGAKSILPGVADEDTVRLNHSLLDLESSATGKLNNPLREAAERAADMVGVDFLLNVVLDHKKRIIKAFAGDVHQAFKAGTKLVDEMYKVPASEKAELVITSPGGYPKDIDLYQSQKAVENALKLVEPGGDIALLAKCPDGWGSDVFEQWVRNCENLQEIRDRIKQRFVIGGHKAYIYAKEKERANLYLISDFPPSDHLKKIFTSIEWETLDQIIDNRNSINILKMGSNTLPVLK